MHFVGMLALSLPLPVAYDVATTGLSMLIAIAVSTFSLHIASRDDLNRPRLAGAGMAMGIGICAMHYVGMAAIAIEPPIRYNPFLVTASFAIATAAPSPRYGSRSARTKAIAGGATGSSRFQRKVLVVEDAEDTRRSLRIALEMNGHEVHTANDGANGLDALLRLRPDIARRGERIRNARGQGAGDGGGLRRPPHEAGDDRVLALVSESPALSQLTR